MDEKVARLGVQRERGYSYYVKEGGVWRVRQSVLGVPNASPQEVAPSGFLEEPNFIYYVDADGDVSRQACEPSADGVAESIEETLSDHPATSRSGNPGPAKLALTVRQPWAAHIASGLKTIENRSWTRPTIIGHRIAIHAAQAFDAESATELNISLPRDGRAWHVVDSITERDTGAIVCTAVVTGFVTSSTNEWFQGPFGWVLDDVRACEPIPCRGTHRLWAIPADIALRLV